MSAPPVRAPAVLRHIATVGGSGYFPWAPATLASLIVLLVYVFLPPLPIPVQAAALLLITWVAVLSSTAAERELGHDAHPIVIDEVAGMMVTYTLVAIPTGLLPRLMVLGLGFVLFRIFDIVKPWPADRLQRLPGGLGIVADDLMAGVYANVGIRLALAFGPACWFVDCP